ncbi:hypothetical protein BKA63DRAFT_508285 [Paraphoma chrysanthemicola]|nr:hypothetical protein BKA63DRAFT_508285 [Paraphoma chrysanthemicola]
MAQTLTEKASILLFWTQVACMTTVLSWTGTEVIFDFPNPPEEFEVILVAGVLRDKILWGDESTDKVKSLDDFFHRGEDHYYGIVIERQGEYKHRVGVAYELTREAWIAANPRKEFIMLI